MTHEEFEKLISEEFPNAIPEKFRHLIKNVALLAEEKPTKELRTLEGLSEGESLLGHYHGIPYPMRGDWYGMGSTMPDVITLFRVPIEEYASRGHKSVREVIRETIWHEIAHHFGMDELDVRRRENEKDDII